MDIWASSCILGDLGQFSAYGYLGQTFALGHLGQSSYVGQLGQSSYVGQSLHWASPRHWVSHSALGTFGPIQFSPTNWPFSLAIAELGDARGFDRIVEALLSVVAASTA